MRGQRCAGRSKREMTVDLHRRPEFGRTRHQSSEGAVAEELVSGADEPLPRPGQFDQRPCVARPSTRTASRRRRGRLPRARRTRPRSARPAACRRERCRAAPPASNASTDGNARQAARAAELFRCVPSSGRARRPLRREPRAARARSGGDEPSWPAPMNATRSITAPDTFERAGPARRVTDSGRRRHTSDETKRRSGRQCPAGTARRARPIGIVYQNSGLSTRAPLTLESIGPRPAGRATEVEAPEAVTAGGANGLPIQQHVGAERRSTLARTTPTAPARMSLKASAIRPPIGVCPFRTSATRARFPNAVERGAEELSSRAPASRGRACAPRRTCRTRRASRSRRTRPRDRRARPSGPGCARCDRAVATASVGVGRQRQHHVDLVLHRLATRSPAAARSGVSTTPAPSRRASSRR
mgnify:CR=1 FL=1